MDASEAEQILRAQGKKPKPIVTISSEEDLKKARKKYGRRRVDPERGFGAGESGL